MIAKVCDRESRRDTWFENRLVFFFLIFNFAFLNKIVKIKVSKYIATVPKVYCLSTEGIYLPHICLHPGFPPDTLMSLI